MYSRFGKICENVAHCLLTKLTQMTEIQNLKISRPDILILVGPSGASLIGKLVSRFGHKARIQTLISKTLAIKKLAQPALVCNPQLL